MVHGFLAGRAIWRANLEALGAVSTPVVIELYGHGRSASPLEPLAYHPDAYVAAFEDIRRELGVDRWFVLGHSLGAALTLRYALDHPDRVIGHVFTNSASALAGRDWREAMVTSAESEADRILEYGLAHLERSKANPARSHRIVPVVREALAVDVPLLQPLGVSGTMRHTGPASTVRERIGGNSRPALLVAGKKERSFAEPCRYVQTAMPNLAIMRVDAGHSPNAEIPDTFNEAVAAFIAGIHP